MALLDSLLYGLGQTESSGNYGALGPQTRSGDRAYGKYQVMGTNVGPWTEQTLGQRLTPEQFLAHPDAQEAVAQKIFGGYVDKYGPAGAASMWFSGRPNQPNVSDGYIATPAYVQRVLKYADQYPANPTGQGSPVVAQMAPALPVPAPGPPNAPAGPVMAQAGRAGIPAQSAPYLAQQASPSVIPTFLQSDEWMAPAARQPIDLTKLRALAQSRPYFGRIA